MGSGVLMAALGVALLLANPRKDWNRVFALFAVFWGAQIVATNVVRVTDDAALARVAGELGLAFLVPLYFFLVFFAAIFPRPRPPFGTSGAALALLTLPALAALAVLFLAPDQLIAAVGPSPEGLTLQWGPLLPYLVTAPFFGALFYALHAMTQRLADAASPLERRQVAFVLGALALYAAHIAPLELVRFGPAALGQGAASEAAGPEAAVFAAIMVVGLVVLARLALVLARVRASGPAHRDARLVLGCLGLGLGSAVLIEGVGLLGGPPLEVLGLLRAGSVALVVYAVARYQLFDIDVRVKAVGPAVAALLAVAALGAAAWVALQLAGPPPSWGGVAVVAAALVAFVPLARAFSRVADRLAPQVSREGDHLYLRKLEVYRAQVEALLRDGKEARADAPDLLELRRKLGLGERDHGVVVSLAHALVEPSAAPDLRPGAVVFGKYVVDSLLAEGGFGRVFLARDRVLGRAVVIKELLARWRGNAAVVRTFLREAQVAGQLSHPNIVSVFAVEQHGQDSYVVMEHCSGGSLGERLRQGSVGQAEAVRIARGVLVALEAAHAKGVVHRDVKPDNVLFDARGEVKLADFGIAQLAEDDQQRTISGLTSRGFQPGTLQYMSPEQARGKALDARSDVYAVGALLYRMLAGKQHLDLAGLDEFEARGRIAAAAPPAEVPGASPALRDAVRRALEPEAAKRFGSAREFREALEEARAVERPRRA